MSWALVMLLAATAAASATTNKSSYGNDFRVGFLRQVSPTSRIEMIILTMSSSPVQFTISSLNGSIYNGTTTAASPTNVTLSSVIQVRETTFAYRQLGLHVSSPPDQPISVVLVGYTTAPRSAYLGLPCYEQPTQEYIYYGMSNGYNEVDGSSFVYYSQILLIGCRDNTTVSITPSQTVQLPQDPQVSNSPLINVTAGSSHTVILHSLQTLLIAAEFVDLSGTKIVSNYPLTVVGGHDCTRVPQPVIYECDPISTQIPPTINWGTQFLITPLNSQSAGQRFKLIASENDTEVNRTCTAGSSVDLIDLKSEGNVTTFDISGNEFCDVSCSHPCYIAELAFSRFSSQGIDNGDPLLMTVPPISQYPHTVTFTTLPDMPTNFYSIAVPADSYYNVTVVINNVLTAPNWTPINGTNGSITGYGYSTAANGTFTISHSHPNGKLYVSVYGFEGTGGYGYVAGNDLKPLLFIAFNPSIYSVNEQTSQAIVYISRSNGVSLHVSISVVTSSNSTANEYIDYIPINETVVFSPGETLKPVYITILDDEVADGTKFFSVRLSKLVNGLGSYETNKEATIVITDNDYVTIGFTDNFVTVNEGANIAIALLDGILQPGVTVSVTLQINILEGKSTTVSSFQFQYSIERYEIFINVTQLALILNVTAESFNMTGRLYTDDDHIVHISPATLDIAYIGKTTQATMCIAVPPNTTHSDVSGMPTNTSVAMATSCTVAMTTVALTSTVTTTYTATETVLVATSAIVSLQPLPTISYSQSSSNSISFIFGGVLAAVLIISFMAVVTSFICGKRYGEKRSLSSNHIQMTNLTTVQNDHAKRYYQHSPTSPSVSSLLTSNSDKTSFYDNLTPLPSTDKNPFYDNLTPLPSSDISFSFKDTLSYCSSSLQERPADFV